LKPGQKINPQYLEIIKLVLLLVATALGTYTAAKPTPATPADVQAAKLEPAQVTEAVWGK
jgi:hypothetical protein